MTEEEFPTKAQVRECADRALAAGGDETDVRLALFTEYNIAMGKGGRGTMPGWPACRYCGAFGGGGHAGMCPA